MAIEHFTVDAALLEELGERLIGAPHIALAELAKNSYDADANSCRIIFGPNSIEVIDDGHGMTLQEFRSFWLRLGTQHKREDEASPILGRPFTGSKGVGRLAVQFLADRLELWTTAESRGAATYKASVDWRTIHAGRALSTVPVEVSRVRKDRKPRYPNRRTHGTRIVLKGLRKTDWGADDIAALGREIWSLRSPFSALRRQRSDRHDSSWFDVDLDAPGIANAQERFNEVLLALTQYVWRAKITGAVTRGRSTDRATISIDFQENYPEGAPSKIYNEIVQLSELRWDKSELPDRPLLDEVSFTIYVYRLEGRQAGRVRLQELKDYLEEFGNVSIYDTGFRLPYYGMKNDWLDVGQDQARRLSKSQLLDAKWNIKQRYLLDLPDPRRLFGAVEINTNQESRVAEENKAKPGEWLLIQSSRDRLHPNLAYEQLRALVRYALDLYANRYQARVLRAKEGARDTEPSSRKYSRVQELLERYRKLIPRDVWTELSEGLSEAEQAANSAEDLFDARTAVLAPLAAAGMTALGLTHELARESRSLDRARNRLSRLAEQHDLPELKQASEDLGASLSRLRSIQGLFTALLSEEDRQAETRLRVEPVVRQVVEAMQPLTPGLQVEISVPADLRFPRASLASWNAVLQNVIANSWNAVLDAPEARVRIHGGSEGAEQWLQISDSGVGLAVGLEESAKYFDAFERDLRIGADRRSIAIGGTGMGLTIVRIICERHGVIPEFVEPDEGYSTTLQLWWKD
ncbi:MAG: sensor histidine kinase [Allosphingosinicella sp.]|uniref:sensor histidine kinase n=1 Tax=Allosphingosinicella sp. TaxID=2823234 RepID=UPI003940715A